MMIDSPKILEIVNIITKEFNPEKIILFGSYATGKIDEDSDIDLLIIKDTNLPYHKRNIDMRRALFGTKVPVDLLVYTNEEFEREKVMKYSFVNQIIENSLILYERKN